MKHLDTLAIGLFENVFEKQSPIRNRPSLTLHSQSTLQYSIASERYQNEFYKGTNWIFSEILCASTLFWI